MSRRSPRRKVTNRADPRGALLWAATLVALVACRSEPESSRPILRYVGSSTVAQFLIDAEPVYRKNALMFDTAPESEGAEQALLEGRADLAGVARAPREDVLAQGIESRCVGFDAIAVVVHASNPIRDLSLEELGSIFRGERKNWSQIGGSDLAMELFVVGPESATRNAFRRAVLRRADYSASSQIVRPDADIVDRVASSPGAIAAISSAFVRDRDDVRVLRIDGRSPVARPDDYPIVRPLHLLWWPGQRCAEDLVEWVHSEAGQAVVSRRFSPCLERLPP